MISFFNKLGNSWIAKIILAVLALSMMVFWGLGGISNTANFDGTAITIGSKKISTMQLVQAFDTERMKLSQLMGQTLPAKQAIEMGLLSQVIQQQITDAVNEYVQSDLGLTASVPAVQKYVERHPAFQDNLGHFDRNLLNAYLNQTKMNDRQLMQSLQKELANQHLANTVRLVAPAPQALMQYLSRYQNEERDIEALLIQQDKIPVKTKPSEEDLKDFYEAYSDDFIQPETRNIQAILVTPDIIGANISVSQQELEALYEDKKDGFDTPEKRDIVQIRFNSEESALQALNELTAANFTEQAKKIGQTTEETNWKEVSQNEILPELAEAAFQAKTSSLIGPVKSSVGWHILMVKKIMPAQKATKQSVLAALKQQIIQEQRYDKMYQTIRDIEDILGEGESLDVVAKKLNLPLKNFTNIDISGTNLPKEFRNQELLQQIFILSKNEATNIVEQQDSFLVAEVKEITPSVIKSFDSVKDEVMTKWLQDQRASLLPQLAEKALSEMKKGSIPATMGELIVAKRIKRTDTSDIPAQAMPAIFKQSIGYDHAINTVLPNARLISVVKKINHPKTLEQDQTALKDQVEQELAEEMYAALLASYTDKLNIQVHNDAIQKAFAAYNKE